VLTLPDGSAKLVPEANENTLWPIANDQPPLQFLVPLIAERQLTGAGSAPGQCPNGPPCPRAEAGDYLQVQVDASIGTPLTLTPVVPLFAAPPQPALTGKPSVAKTGRSVKVQAAAGAKVSATLSAKGRTLAKGSATATKAGTLTVKLKPTAALKKLKGTIKAKLKLAATGTGLVKTERSVTVRVRG
jgi:hypothetical protein